MGSIELYEDIHTAQRQRTTQILIEMCVLVLGIWLGLGIGLWRCEWTIKVFTMHLSHRFRIYEFDIKLYEYLFTILVFVFYKIFYKT